MGKNSSNLNNLSTKTPAHYRFLLNQLHQSEEYLTNIRQKINEIKQLKSEVNKMIAGLNKIIEVEQIEVIKKSFKINK